MAPCPPGGYLLGLGVYRRVGNPSYGQDRDASVSCPVTRRRRSRARMMFKEPPRNRGVGSWVEAPLLDPRELTPAMPGVASRP